MNVFPPMGMRDAYAGYILAKNGILYPLKIANATVAAQAGIQYYIHHYNVCGRGDATIGHNYVQITQNGATKYLFNTTGGSEGSAALAGNPGILCDSNTAITEVTDVNTTPVIVYAEIPG